MIYLENVLQADDEPQTLFIATGTVASCTFSATQTAPKFVMGGFATTAAAPISRQLRVNMRHVVGAATGTAAFTISVELVLRDSLIER